MSVSIVKYFNKFIVVNIAVKVVEVNIHKCLFFFIEDTKFIANSE